ncbi:hypothetical protein ACFWY6_08470 [Streptomyces sp. NPDC059037]|uniref:hypothetical protein n=1 Tax=Streptomyces sp. NPDC059037 TaxID=3346710 RepID=UPI0036CEE99A
MSYNQPGPYGGQQPQQPGPYGQQPQAPQPGYGYPQQPQAPYGQPPQAPYGQVPPPPAGGGGGKKTGLIIGAVVALVAIAGGVWWFTAGGGSSDVADDGKTYKLTTPATVLGEYKKQEGAGGGMEDDDLKELEQAGVTDPKNVNGNYQAGDGATMKAINFGGAYGDIEDPEKVVDAMFAQMKKNAETGDSEGMHLKGEPEEFTPDGFENGIMKCQEAEFRMGGADSAETEDGIPNTFQVPMCVWGDHSTVAFVGRSDASATATGKKLTMEDTASMAAKLRDEVRVEVK